MDRTEQAMIDVVEETFSSLAFMFPVEDFGACEPEDALRAAVDFSGPFGGTLLLSVSPAILEPLTANMLGLDEEAPTLEQKHDAFRELLNVLCGNLLPVITSPREVFNVHEPKALNADEAFEPAAELTASGTADVELEEGHVRLMLFVEDPQAIGASV